MFQILILSVCLEIFRVVFGSAVSNYELINVPYLYLQTNFVLCHIHSFKRTIFRTFDNRTSVKLQGLVAIIKISYQHTNIVGKRVTLFFIELTMHLCTPGTLLWYVLKFKLKNKKYYKIWLKVCLPTQAFVLSQISIISSSIWK